jgi:hypothetical protein
MTLATAPRAIQFKKQSFKTHDNDVAGTVGQAIAQLVIGRPFNSKNAGSNVQTRVDIAACGIWQDVARRVT